MMNRKAFTLIELLIVIAILGILVALILPRFGDVREDANTKVCTANLRGLASAMATYETKENNGLVPWGSLAVTDLETWGYVADEPFCPYEATTKTSYTLVAGATSTDMDYATCPQVGTYADHVWPTP